MATLFLLELSCDCENRAEKRTRLRKYSHIVNSGDVRDSVAIITKWEGRGKNERHDGSHGPTCVSIRWITAKSIIKIPQSQVVYRLWSLFVVGTDVGWVIAVMNCSTVVGRRMPMQAGKSTPVLASYRETEMGMKKLAVFLQRTGERSGKGGGKVAVSPTAIRIFKNVKIS